MPRNDQVTRQWHLLRTMEASREGVTLHGLADGLPAEFSRHHRTIRRDLDALEAAGFPLLTDKVEGRGVVWKLLEGFRRVPALAFSPTELMALTFSRGLLRPLEGTQLQAALDSALTKAAAALPAPGTPTSSNSTAASPSAWARMSATVSIGRPLTS